MWSQKRTAVFALIALGTWACSPDEYPTASRFEPPPEEITLPDGELFFYVPPAGVSVSAVSLRGSFNDWGETPMEELSDGRWVVGVELDPGTYEYKYYFNNADWATDMCNDPVYGDPANGGKVDAEVSECAGGNGVRQVGTPGHTFLYIVPDSVDVAVVTVQGSFQDPVWQADADSLTNIWHITVELAPGTYQYKYHFNGTTWAQNMCDEPDWGHPDHGDAVDPNNDNCVEGGQDAEITIDEAGEYTFTYIAPPGIVDDITRVQLVGSMQGWNDSDDAYEMTETFERRFDLAPGTYQYKFRFDGNWAGNMCAEPTWAEGGMADANGQGCVEGGEDAEITIE